MKSKKTEPKAKKIKTKEIKGIAVKEKAAGSQDVSLITLYNMTGKEVGSFQLDKELFDGKVHKGMLYQAVRMYQANSRQGNASTKTRGDVSGGGKKPWRQKGTGRARAGSTRSPLWRHGGVVFGPHPRDYHYQLPKKLKRLAFLSSINSKLVESRLIGLDDLVISEPKTRKIKDLLGALKLAGKTLFVVAKADDNALRASRNLKEVLVRNCADFNTMDVIKSDNLVISKQALEKLSERFKV